MKTKAPLTRYPMFKIAQTDSPDTAPEPAIVLQRHSEGSSSSEHYFIEDTLARSILELFLFVKHLSLITLESHPTEYVILNEIWKRGVEE